MTEREFWIEVHRGLGHVLRGVGAISAAIARRYALGAGQAATRPSGDNVVGRGPRPAHGPPSD